MKQRSTSLRERSKFICMWLSGKSARTIARETGVSTSTIFLVANVMKPILALLLLGCAQTAGLIKVPHRKDSTAFAAVESIFTTSSTCEYTAFLLTDGEELFPIEIQRVQAPRGISVFQVAPGNQSDKGSHTQMMATVDKVRQMGQLWHCPVLVVVGDVPEFLSTFARLSLRSHALKWSMKILVVTRLSLGELGDMHGLLSFRNAMLLHAKKNKETGCSRVNVDVWLPYSAPNNNAMRVATWKTRGNLTIESNMSLFPEKFLVFRSAPTLVTAVELLAHHTLSWVEDSSVPGGRRLAYTGYVNTIVQHLAKAMNFTVRYVLSVDRTGGIQLSNGSWTGIFGMVVREEADFTPGPFQMSFVRKAAAELTIPFYIGQGRILSRLTGEKIDPWCFLLPLTPLVWAATLTALLVVLTVLLLFPSCPLAKTIGCRDSLANAFSCVRIILQQDVVLPAELWERLVLGMWMLTTLLLTKSYAGNLMSLLAVRYIPQPFQTLQDVVDNRHVAVIFAKYSTYEQHIRDAKSGVLREVAQLENKGRLRFHTQAQIPTSIDTLVRSGQYVFADADINVKSHLASDFSRKGRCDFYMSREGFLPYSAVMISQKTNPLIHHFNKRLRTMVEQGLVTYWSENIPNLTECTYVPKKVLVKSEIALLNIWGVFVLLATGLAVGFLAFQAEMFVTLML